MSYQADFNHLKAHLESVIVGQPNLLNRLLIALLTGGHLLIESPPGLAKTTAVKTLADGIHANFQRIQFTPDLMPSDITGNEIFNPQTREFDFKSGPLFNHLVLADEINRAPPKVQSALLEAMEEHQVTIAGQSHTLPDLFLVLATQNPLEQSGTYPLPEAQMDRFLFQVVLDYPTKDEEFEILTRDDNKRDSAALEVTDNNNALLLSPLTPETVLNARGEINDVHIEESVKSYVVDLVQATRDPSQVNPEWDGFIQYGASPRASLALVKSSRAYAYLAGRDYVTPDDVIAVASDVLRHRILPSFSAKAAGYDTARLVSGLLALIVVP